MRDGLARPQAANLFASTQISCGTLGVFPSPLWEGLGVGVVVILLDFSSSIQSIFESGTR
jgi:hypothetical protein